MREVDVDAFFEQLRHFFEAFEDASIVRIISVFEFAARERRGEESFFRMVEADEEGTRQFGPERQNRQDERCEDCLAE